MGERKNLRTLGGSKRNVAHDTTTRFAWSRRLRQRGRFGGCRARRCGRTGGRCITGFAGCGIIFWNWTCHFGVGWLTGSRRRFWRRCGGGRRGGRWSRRRGWGRRRGHRDWHRGRYEGGAGQRWRGQWRWCHGAHRDGRRRRSRRIAARCEHRVDAYSTYDRDEQADDDASLARTLEREGIFIELAGEILTRVHLKCRLRGRDDIAGRLGLSLIREDDRGKGTLTLGACRGAERRRRDGDGVSIGRRSGGAGW
jgi:hypothetical protein